ncbi:MAG: HPP family protein [Acidobacteria bacterium]|nr:HPP family protein [Acidobacteriota bacterium]
MARDDYWVAPLLEAALIGTVALCGWLTHQPLVFASLGPTAFEMVETPTRPSARPYNIIVGNLVALLAAYGALWLTQAWCAPSVSAQGVPLARVWAAMLAALFTVLFTLLLKATQPAALSTTLLVALGVMQTPRDGALILAAVIWMTLLGLPVRRWRERKTIAAAQR